MILFYYEEKIIEEDLKPNYINCDAIEFDGESIMLPYENSTIIKCIRPLIDDVVMTMRPKWEIPDYKRSKCYFYILGQEISLLVEALPKRYSITEKQSILETVSHAIRQDGYSDYCELLDKFDIIESIMNVSCPSGEMFSYQLEISPEERATLFSLIK